LALANISIYLPTYICIKSSIAGLPDFSWYLVPKPENVPNYYEISQVSVKIFQMAIKYINIFQSKELPKFNLIGIFGLKINHLATLAIV
jgi:hypothetical protein